MEEYLINGKTYVIIRSLEHGKGSYSCLVRNEEKQYVLKNIHLEPCADYEFGNKIEVERNDYHQLLESGITIPMMIIIDLENEIII